MSEIAERDQEKRYSFVLFKKTGSFGRGHVKKLSDLERDIISQLKAHGVSDEKISRLTKLNLSISYINKTFRIKP